MADLIKEGKILSWGISETSEQLRFENTHEALINQQTWEIVQDIRKHKRRPAKFAERNMFSGLVCCLDCGSTMVLHCANTMDAVKNNFMCPTYKKKGKEAQREIAALQKKIDTMQKRETELTKLLYLLPGHYCGNTLFLRKRC